MEGNEERPYDLDPHEAIAIKFVDILDDIKQLKKRKRKDNRVDETIADYMAEMFRGSKDLETLQILVSQAFMALRAKEKKHEKPLVEAFEASLGRSTVVDSQSPYAADISIPDYQNSPDPQ